MNIRQTIKRAVTQYGHETQTLEFLPENRYNTSLFPTTGQYDWFSGQVLYCLIRYLKPARILEISTASGYATLYMGMALKKNAWGKVDTYELEPKSARAAMQLFKKYEVDRHIHCHVGDARKTSINAASDYTIYFLDSLHTEEFARWFLESHVQRSDRIDALFHMHDILPLHARVRRYNAPPFVSTEFDPHIETGPLGNLKRSLCNLLRRQHEEEGAIPIQVYPPEGMGSLETFDGNCTTEAVWGNRLASFMKKEENVFLYDIANDYPELSPRKYDHTVIGRTDSQNKPMEWNETWWCTVSALKAAYRRLSEVSAPEGTHDAFATSPTSVIPVKAGVQE